MVLSKANKKSPIDIANQLIDLIKKKMNDIENITVAKPGFINIRFKSIYWNNFVKEINKIIKILELIIKEKKKNILLNLFQLIQLVHYMLVIVEVQF